MISLQRARDTQGSSSATNCYQRFVYHGREVVHYEAGVRGTYRSTRSYSTIASVSSEVGFQLFPSFKAHQWQCRSKVRYHSSVSRGRPEYAAMSDRKVDYLDGA
jgi:hypothetical protein